MLVSCGVGQVGVYRSQNAGMDPGIESSRTSANSIFVKMSQNPIKLSKFYSMEKTPVLFFLCRRGLSSFLLEFWKRYQVHLNYFIFRKLLSYFFRGMGRIHAIRRIGSDTTANRNRQKHRYFRSFRFNRQEYFNLL